MQYRGARGEDPGEAGDRPAITARGCRGSSQGQQGMGMPGVPMMMGQGMGASGVPTGQGLGWGQVRVGARAEGAGSW